MAAGARRASRIAARDRDHPAGDQRAALGPRPSDRYVGSWLPEPITTAIEDVPARHAGTADSLSLAMLVVLERRSPEQRAALLLRGVFDYRYPESAGIIGRGEDDVRELATRARRQAAAAARS